MKGHNKDNSDNFLFEIDDTAYLVTYFGTLLLGIIILSLIYFIDSTLFSGDHRSFLASTGSMVLILISLINIYLYLSNNNMKIRFYKDHIERTRLNMQVNLNKLTEAYILKLNISSGPIKKRSNSKFFAFLSIIIAGPLMLTPMVLASFIISLFNKRKAPYMNTLLLIEDDGYTSVSFPLNTIKTEDFTLIKNYLKEYLSVEIKDIQHGFIKVAGEPIKNFPHNNLSIARNEV